MVRWLLTVSMSSRVTRTFLLFSKNQVTNRNTFMSHHCLDRLKPEYFDIIDKSFSSISTKSHTFSTNFPIVASESTTFFRIKNKKGKKKRTKLEHCVCLFKNLLTFCWLLLCTRSSVSCAARSISEKAKLRKLSGVNMWLHMLVCWWII